MNILPRNPYLSKAGFLKILILLTSKNGQFSEKIAKPLKGGVKCLKNKGKRLYLQEIYYIFDEFYPKIMKKWRFCSKKHENINFLAALRALDNAYLAEFAKKSLLFHPPPTNEF